MSREEFIIEDGVLKEYKGAEEEVEIPGGVTQIGWAAFRGNKNLRRIKIPGSVTKIWPEAFRNCKNLEEIEFSQEIEDIDQAAFAGCERLKKIVLPKGLRSVARGAFDGCKNVERIVIPKSLEQMGERAFGTLSPSCDVIFEENPDWPAVKKALEPAGETLRVWVKDVNISKAAVRLRKAAVRGFASHYLAGDTMREEQKESALKYLKNHIEDFLADRDCLAVMLQEKLIPAGKLPACMDAAEKLKNPEFTAMLLEYRHKNFSQEEMEKAENKAIERVLSGAGPAVKELQKSWLFQSVKDGREITAYKGTERVVFVPEKIGREEVTAIGEYAFSPNQQSAAAKNVRAREAIEEIFLPGSLKRIGWSAFYGCSSLKRVHISERTTEIDIWAFNHNSPELTICAPEGSYAQKYVRERPVLGQGPIRFEKEGTVEEKRFRKYSGQSPEFVIETATLLRYMGAGGDVEIPDEVKVIGVGAFSGCAGVTGVSLPKNVEEIREKAFYDCIGLARIAFQETAEPALKRVNQWAFEGVNPACEIVLKGRVLFRMPEVWTLSGAVSQASLCIWAKDMEISDLPVELRSEAAKGFARHFSDASEMSGTVRAGYVKYIKRNCERLVMDADCRRVILQEKYITARKIDDYLKEAKRCWREDVVRELLEYKEKNFS